MIVQKNWQKDVRRWTHDFMCRAMFKNTYSEFGAASRLDFDPNSFVGSQARRLCGDFGLNRALSMISVFTFSKLFSTFVWPFWAASGRVLDVSGLCVYMGLH